MKWDATEPTKIFVDTKSTLLFQGSVYFATDPAALSIDVRLYDEGDNLLATSLVARFPSSGGTSVIPFNRPITFLETSSLKTKYITFNVTQNKGTDVDVLVWLGISKFI